MIADRVAAASAALSGTPMIKSAFPDVAAIGEVVGDTPAISDDARSPVPIVWLIGKVQSGKSSIVRAVTQSSEAEIGSGFKACTSSAQMFDFPSDYPVLRFLDTRGLGENNYDPCEDLAIAEKQAHLLLVTMRAMDVAQNAILDVVRSVRRKHPDWPIVVAQTCLHEGYVAGHGHGDPYPFNAEKPDDTPDDRPELSPDLLRSLKHQRELFASVAGTAPVVFVPIDLTLPTDGMPPADFGLDALANALIKVAPQAMLAALLALPAATNDDRSRRAAPIILGHAVAAGGSDLVPIAGGVAVSAIQARLLQRIGQVFGVTWNRQLFAEFVAVIGAGVAVRTLAGMGARQLVKLIPIYGQTLGAATSAGMSYAVTFAMGKAAVYFLTQQQRGLATAGTAAAYQEALSDALRRSKDTHASPTSEPVQP